MPDMGVTPWFRCTPNARYNLERMLQPERRSRLYGVAWRLQATMTVFLRWRSWR